MKSKKLFDFEDEATEENPQEEDSIADLFSKDEWVMGFMSEIYEAFGLPTSTQFCLNKNDKLLFVWGMMSLVKAMKTHDFWKELRSKNVNPEDAAYDFIKSYYEKTGNMLIDSTYNVI